MVTLYQNNYFKGSSQEFCFGRHDVRALGDVGNDTVSSLKVADGCSVTLFQNPRFKGRSATFQAGNHDCADLVGSGIPNDSVSSLIVEKTCSCLIGILGSNKIALKSVHGKYLVAEKDGTVNANRVERKTWETFTVEELGANKMALVSAHRKYVAAADSRSRYSINANSANRRSRDQREIFTVEVLEEGGIALKTAHGRYISADDCDMVTGDKSEAKAWETFSPECV